MISTLFYHPEAYNISGPKLMGRNAAGESFLRGFLAHSNTTELWVQVNDPKHADDFLEKVSRSGRTEPVRAIYSNSLRSLSKSGLIFYPGPEIGKQSFARAALQCHSSWSLCGITHTTSSANAMDAIVNLITSPIQSWDALICTSKAAKKNVECILQAQVDYLKDRLAIQKVVLPQLPVIPLGIHTKDFIFSVSEKQSARKKLAISDDAIVVLFMGRLSFHAKAHPLAMYQALEAAIHATHKKIILVECGWYSNEYISKAFDQAAKKVSSSLTVVNLDGRIEKNRRLAWACADVFCSLSDNIQETFGIVPIEAMASGLPVVVADWDGYKDTVREGIDGFRIPTLMPQAGLGNDLAYLHAVGIDSYDMYCGKTCSLVSVDVQAATEAFIKLFESFKLRQEMGEAGRQRAIKIYDWKQVMAEYESLWAHLNEIRKQNSSELKPLNFPWPARLDPFHSFSHYSTATLLPETVLCLVDNDIDIALRRVDTYRSLSMIDFAKDVLPNVEESNEILKAATLGSQTTIDLISSFPKARQPFLFRSLVWFLKIGVLRTMSQ